MRKGNGNRVVFGLATLAFGAVLASAHSYGPPPGTTAAPGEDSRACAQCHTGTALNAGGGKVEIILPNGPTYSPGVAQHIMVRVSDPAQRRWGFQFSARLNSDLANGQAGDLKESDGLTMVVCSNGASKPCATAGSTLQFIEHTPEGTRLGTPNGATFEFDWTPPATDVGNVTFYAAGNAANGNGSSSGDHIYTAHVELTSAAPAGAPAKPTISRNGVVSSATLQPTIAPNSWITISGSNFASTSRSWKKEDIQNGRLPSSLDGLSVTVNNKPAYVEFISSSQINALTPDDTSSGAVEVKVTNAAGTSDPVTVQMQQPAPGFFLFDNKYLAAAHADGKAIGKVGLFPPFPNLTTPAKPGEIIVLYATGCGATDPPATAGQVVAQVSKLVTPPRISIGGLPADVQFAGLIPGFAGLYQFNVMVPSAVGDGDQPVIADLNGIVSPSGPSCCFITIEH